MKLFLRRLLVAFTILCALVYFISCLTPHISPIAFSPMTFLALGYPYLAALLMLFIIVWFFVKRKVSGLLLILLGVGYQNIFSTLAFHFASANKASANALTVLAWNVRGFDNPSIYSDTPGSIRRQMMNYIKSSGADILCLQEFAEHNGKGMYSNTKELTDVGYPYHLLTNDIPYHFFWGDVTTGSAIFSKVPLLDSGRILLGDSSNPEHLGFADIQFAGKRLRVYTTHLKSYNFFPVFLDSNSMVSFHGDKTFFYTASKYEKLKLVNQDHVREARIIKEVIDKSQSPFLFSADLNDVPTSYTYHLLKKGLQDAFLKKGCGLGPTLDKMPPTLRIDCMLADRRISIENYHQDQLHLSDHYPHIVHVNWQ